jgi:hypothetical protein
MAELYEAMRPSVNIQICISTELYRNVGIDSRSPQTIRRAIVLDVTFLANNVCDTPNELSADASGQAQFGMHRIFHRHAITLVTTPFYIQYGHGSDYSIVTP